VFQTFGGFYQPLAELCTRYLPNGEHHPIKRQVIAGAKVFALEGAAAGEREAGMQKTIAGRRLASAVRS
jgi:hypothetical protein